MTEDTENSSLPLLLVISSAVVLVAVGGWFLLEQDPAVPAQSAFSPPEPLVAPAEAIPTEPEVDEQSPVDIDAELLKAQLAAEADILVFPRSQSALHYYGNILSADPRHAVANAEMDAVLARVGQTVSDHLAASEYAEAYEIASHVVAYRPEHELVIETQRILDAQTEVLVQQAIQSAQDGDDGGSASALAEAQALPGRNPDYFAGVRGSIEEIQEVRQAAEADRQRRSSLAAAQAREAWIDATRNAIRQGNLISPAGANARDLLEEDNNWEEDREELTGELLAALRNTARGYIAAAQPALAETLLDAAIGLGASPDTVDELRADLENAFARVESSRVITLDELVRVKTVAPKYPRRAEERGLTGSVDVEFTVTTDGSTSDILVVAAEPESTFDDSAIAAVERWQFEPRRFRGRVIDQRAAARLIFRIEE